MENLDVLLNNLTGKNEKEAEKAAHYMVNNTDLELFKMLVNKSDFLFDFVRNNVNKRIEKAVTKNNYKNILKFFDIYSPYYDDTFADILSKHANQDLTDEIFELLENGTLSQKTYAAKYFAYIPDTVALEPLAKYAFDENDYLSFNSAQALGQMNDDISYDIALNSLYSEDDFEKLKAVKFFTAYQINYPVKEIFNAMKTSKMSENIAGQIPYSVSLLSLLDSEYKMEALETIDYILSGLGEILPFSDIFQFELYDIIKYLIELNSNNNEYSGKISEVLLSSLSKFNMFCENQEYIFDEDKHTKDEIYSIQKLLTKQSTEFWNNQKIQIIQELNSSDDRIIAAVPVIKEYNLTNAAASLINLLKNTNNEIILYELSAALKFFNKLNEDDKRSVLLKIQNPNIKAMIENLN